MHCYPTNHSFADYIASDKLRLFGTEPAVACGHKLEIWRYGELVLYAFRSRLGQPLPYLIAGDIEPEYSIGFEQYSDRMNWQRVETVFNSNDFKNFHYNIRPFKIVRKPRSQSQEVECWDIRTSITLAEWIKKYGRSMQEDCRYGTIAILFGRSGEYPQPSSLPVSKEEFIELIDLFHIHPTIVRTIRREVASFSRTYFCDGTIVYAARTCSTWRQDDIALSSTYLSHERLNLSVFYGCTEEQSEAIKEDMGRVGNAIYHPLLPAELLVELDRRRLVKKIDLVNRNFVAATETMSHATRDLEAIWTRILMNQDSIMESSSVLCHRIRELVKGVGIVKHQISFMIRHIDELEYQRHARRLARARMKPEMEHRSSSLEMCTWENPNTESRLRERLVEIAVEYEQKLDQCQKNLDGLGFTMQRASDLANIRIGVAANDESTQMRSIALVTMIFLPMTTVASIFSMGVFNWQATTDKSVLTFYFWVYIAIAGLLTLVTIGTWWMLTRRRILSQYASWYGLLILDSWYLLISIVRT